MANPLPSQKRFTVQQKLEILAQAKSSIHSKVHVCKKFGIARKTFCKWQKQLAHLIPSDSSEELKKQIASLYKQIVELKAQLIEKDAKIDILHHTLSKDMGTEKGIKTIKQAMEKETLTK
uniref:Transposase n=1 Tax=Fervidobacterium nodosum TaxID=2424 RepID=A0A7C5YAB0_9BACT